jgi:hypothetical protein
LQQNLKSTSEHNRAAFETMRRYAKSTKQFGKRANTVGGRSSLGGSDPPAPTMIQPSWVNTFDREDQDQMASLVDSTAPAPEGGGAPQSDKDRWDYRRITLPKKARKAQEAYDAKKFEEAQTRFDELFQKSEEILRENFNNRDQILAMRAAIYCRRQLWAEAEKILENRFDGWQTAITRLVLSYFRHERWDDAERVLSSTDIPTSDVIHSKKYLMCEIYYGQGKYEQAIASCETLINEVIVELGQNHVMQQMCVKLLAKIFLAKGESDEATYLCDELPTEIEGT